MARVVSVRDAGSGRASRIANAGTAEDNFPISFPTRGSRPDVVGGGVGGIGDGDARIGKHRSTISVHGLRLCLSLGMAIVVAGCVRPVERPSDGKPVSHEVRRPLSPVSSPPVAEEPAVESQRPIEILFPEIPEVPESIRGPSPPIDEAQRHS